MSLGSADPVQGVNDPHQVAGECGIGDGTVGGGWCHGDVAQPGLGIDGLDIGVCEERKDVDRGFGPAGSMFRKEFPATLGPVEVLVAAVVVEEEQDAEVLVPEGAATECKAT